LIVALQRAAPRSDRSKGGQLPYDHILMFKVLILQANHSLSDERTEYLIKDRLSFMRFLGLRGEPRVCSMVPIPSEADEEARRAHREREDLTGSRRSLVNKIDGILATLGISGFRALRRDRREQLANLRQPDGAPVPPAAQERIERLLDRLELVLRRRPRITESVFLPPR
jgi:transposase